MDEDDNEISDHLILNEDNIPTKIPTVAFWNYIGFGLSCMLILIGIGSCIALDQIK